MVSGLGKIKLDAVTSIQCIPFMIHRMSWAVPELICAQVQPKKPTDHLLAYHSSVPLLKKILNAYSVFAQKLIKVH